HALWQQQHVQLVGVRAGQHAGGADGQPMVGIVRCGKRRTHVCRPGAARHHVGHQYSGHAADYADGRQRGGEAMSESAKPADSGSSPRDPPMTPGLGEVLGVAGGVAPPVPAPGTSEPVPPRPPPPLGTRLRTPRTFVNAVFSGVIMIMAVVALAPLFSVLATLIYRGGERLGPALFLELPPAARMRGGGIGNAVLGTLLMVGIASLISVPAGVLGAAHPGAVAPGTSAAPVVPRCG